MSGVLKAGYDADVVASGASPLQDVSVQANPKNVTHVWKAGKLP
jgi:imidazolonepropionase-like amidohydrolase